MLNPDTISRAIDVNQTLAPIQFMPNRWAQSHELSISTRTIAFNGSMPNQWAQSHELSMSAGHIAHIISTPNQWARSCQLSMLTRTLTIN